MSRVGKKPISIPSGVTVELTSGLVKVTGPQGTLTLEVRPEAQVAVEDGQVVVSRDSEARFARSYHGTVRSLIANMVQGVTEGYQRALEVYGTGYGVQLQGQNLTITCGKSHPDVLPVPMGVTVDVTNPQARGDTSPATFMVKGACKQAVGEFAAKCRRCRPPEPYKGKGVRYADERVRRKVGKAFAGGG